MHDLCTRIWWRTFHDFFSSRTTEGVVILTILFAMTVPPCIPTSHWKRKIWQWMNECFWTCLVRGHNKVAAPYFSSLKDIADDELGKRGIQKYIVDLFATLVLCNWAPAPCLQHHASAKIASTGEIQMWRCIILSIRIWGDFWDIFWACSYIWEQWAGMDTAGMTRFFIVAMINRPDYFQPSIHRKRTRLMTCSFSCRTTQVVVTLTIYIVKFAMMFHFNPAFQIATGKKWEWVDEYFSDVFGSWP